MVAWLPLAVLSIVEGSFLRSRDNDDSFLLDIAAHARFLLALPTFAVAEALLAPRLGTVVQHFRDVGAVRADDQPRFDQIVLSTRELANSRAAELIAIAAGYAIIAALLVSSALQELPGWVLSRPGRLSMAGWWLALVSLPLLLIALVGMLWRWCLWVRLLWLISRLNLALVPSHPDGVAGLQFVSYVVRAYAPYGFLLGVIVAGSLANRVLYDQVSPLDYSHLLVGLLVVVVVLFSSPGIVFTRTLLETWRRGILDYDLLVSRVGRQFEDAWLGHGESADANALSRPDFSATTDLYSVVANVYRMRLFLFDLQGILLLVCATAAPFVPVVLAAVPIDTILARIASVLL